MDVMDLLDELEEIIEERKFLGKKKDILDLIQEIRLAMPDEIKKAQWVKDEKQQILYDAKKEADTMLAEANNRIERLIDDSEIVAGADAKAQEILKKAEKEAQANISESEEKAEFIVQGAFEYADELFKTVEKKLMDMQKTMENNRLTLQKMSEKK